jgi:hypothetical protein
MQEPLTRLLIVTQYDDEPTKTRRPRGMPVHPVLEAMLREYRDYWWPVLYGRKPKPDDFIVPLRGRGRARADAERGCRNANTMLKQLHADCERLGLRLRRQHDLRRTCISMARGDGADKHALKACTHGEKGDVMDDYTTWDWRDLCRAISCLQFALPASEPTLRLAALDPVASRQGWNTAGRAALRGRMAPALTPTAKASVGGGVSARNLETKRVTPTGIEAGGQVGFSPETSTVCETRAGARVAKSAANQRAVDEALTPGASELDMRDALLAGAAALLDGRVVELHERARLATVLELAARRFESLAAEERAKPSKQHRRRPAG